MMMRAIKNIISFASAINTFRIQDSAAGLTGPDGECLAFVPYGEEALLAADIDLSRATGPIASRFNSDFYPAG